MRADALNFQCSGQLGFCSVQPLITRKFIGHLFLRQLLAVKAGTNQHLHSSGLRLCQVIGQVVHDLIGIKDGNTVPEEHMIECLGV